MERQYQTKSSDFLAAQLPLLTNPQDVEYRPSIDLAEANTEERHRDVYTLVTERIEAALDAGTVPWKKPWASDGGMPRNLVTGKPYRGMNLLLLSIGQPYRSPWWITFRQALDLNGHVRRGEKSSLVTFWKFPEQRTGGQPDTGEDDADPTQARKPPVLRYYNVFNLEQCEGIAAPKGQEAQFHQHDRIERCEMLVEGMRQRPSIKRDPRQAMYSPSADVIGIPDLDQFQTPEDYYATLFHELVHSTGHPSRLNRPALATPIPFGSTDYSKEELVAEFGAAFLCGHTGILPSTVENQASYINGWLGALRRDKRLLLLAASQAQRATDFILGSSASSDLDPTTVGLPTAS